MPELVFFFFFCLNISKMGCLQSCIKINECCLGGDRMTLKPMLLGTVYARFNLIMHLNGGIDHHCLFSSDLLQSSVTIHFIIYNH